MVSNIVESYARYIESQDEGSVDELFGAMLSYDFAGYDADILEMARIHERANPQADGAEFLRTNGSTRGVQRTYEFRPHFARWAGHIESFLRALYCGPSIMLCCRIGSGRPPNGLSITEVDNNKRHYDASGNLLEDDQLHDLFRHIKGIHGERGKVSLSAFPDVWNMLFSNPSFNHLCEENRDRISFLVNSDFEMLFRNDEFLIRDQMINWSSGLNFYTCEAGAKHFLPMFQSCGGCINLLNTAAERDGSDSVHLEPPGRCSCGRAFVPMQIGFHRKNTILGLDGRGMDFSPLRGRLKGRYATLQIHQDEMGRVTVFMTPVGQKNDGDLELLNSFFSGFEMSVDFNRYFEVGSKRYCFWRSAHVEAKEFRLK